MYKLIVFAFLTTGAFTSEYMCPLAMGKYPFDHHKFGGLWHVIATSSGGGKCAEVLVDGDNFKTYNFTYLLPNNTEVSDDVYLQPIFGNEKSSLILTVLNTGGNYIGPFTQTILATDYDSHAAILICRMTFDEKSKKFAKHMWGSILGRKKTMDADSLAALKNLISSYGIEEIAIKNVAQENCR